MIAATRLRPPTRAQPRVTFLLPGLCVLLVGSAFFPYPALSVGSSTGLQLSQALGVALLIPAVAQHVNRRCTIALYLLMAPAIVSAAVIVLSGRAPDNTLALKSTATLLLSLSILVPAGWLMLSGRARLALGTAAVAILLHACVGGLQIVAFRSHTFPLLWLYRNPSFASLTAVAEGIATYVQRPFGLFPEPSAMAASIGPWVCLLIAEALRPRLAPESSGAFRLLLGFGATAGCLLLIASRSGEGLIIAGCLAIIVLAEVWSRAPRGRRHQIVVPAAAGLLVVVGLVAAVTQSTSGRIAIETQQGSGGSWHDRAKSITFSVVVITSDPLTFLTGLGPGEAEPLVRASHINSSGAIFSNGFRQAAETGAIGITAMLAIAGIASVAVSRSRERLLGSVVLLAWLSGVLLATAYISLEAMWVCLALLLNWERIACRT
jgi:hypothetical protein